jgi:prolyl-tRNA synthetase
MMGDGKALQAATSHNLGQNFAKSVNIQFQDADKAVKYAWTTSWGASTRMVGGIIMVHGDSSGLRMPPRVAPIQVVIVPIWRKEEERVLVAEAIAKLESELRAEGIRVKSDWREERPGFKYNDWELRGVPIRLEIGPRDVQNGQVVLVPRTDRTAKEVVSHEGVVRCVQERLDMIQQVLYDQALAFQKSRTYRVDSYGEFTEILADKARMGFIETWWCGDGECEAKIKAETQATIRCLPLDHEGGSGTCIGCGRPASNWAIFARAY